MVCETVHVHFHKYKVHVRADTWDGSKCLLVNAGALSGLGQGKRRGWLRNPSTPSGAEGELVLLDGLFDPSPQAGLVESLDERLLGRVVLCGRLLCFVVGAGLQHLDPQNGRQLRTQRKESKHQNNTNKPKTVRH